MAVGVFVLAAKPFPAEASKQAVANANLLQLHRSLLLPCLGSGVSREVVQRVLPAVLRTSPQVKSKQLFKSKVKMLKVISGLDG